MAKLGGDDPVEYVRRTGLLEGRSWLMVLVVIVAVLFLFNCTTRVETGHVGVLTFFSRVTGETLPEGLHLINPLKSVHEMSVQTQTVKETANVPSNEGLILTLDTTLQYRLDAAKAADVFQKIGRDYVEKVVEPNLRSAVREATASHSANALYTGAREEVANAIQEQLTAVLAPRGIYVERVLLRDIQLPAMLKTSIEAKQQAEQDALRMSFILQKEKQEAERKRIEAQGISDFQRIVAQGISPQLLEWKGIEATEKLAGSNNAKIVIVGNTKNGLPLIFEPH
ncbi:MAG TPA: prohibitin family protein [Candidatus Binatia bacterium]|nr:prohibitin family protein [Candidatus Binatia bacterium]